MLHFPGQREGEEILAVIRKHPIVYLRILFAFMVVIVIPLFVFLLIWFSYYPYSDYPKYGIIVSVFASIYVLYGLLFVCIAWINEAFDIFIITSQRLIDIEQVNLLSRNVATTPLEQIQDTTSDINGLLPTVLNYGDIFVQTAAGSASDFHIDRISDPATVARNILNWAHKRRQEVQR